MVLLEMKGRRKKKINNIIIVLLIILFNKENIFCQRVISGKIIDEKDHVVFNANVILYHPNISKEATTEVDGAFFFSGYRNDECRIIISAMGYIKIDTVFKLLNDTTNLVIRLRSLDIPTPKVEWRGGILTYEDSNKFLRSVTINKNSEIFEQTYTKLYNYLITGQVSFKKSVFLVENAFLDGNINELEFQRSIDSIINLIKIIENIGNHSL